MIATTFTITLLAGQNVIKSYVCRRKTPELTFECKLNHASNVTFSALTVPKKKTKPELKTDINHPNDSAHITLRIKKIIMFYCDLFYVMESIRK